MPAPSVETIKENIRKKFIEKKLTKKEIDSEGNIRDTGIITYEAELMISAISEAIAETWNNWQKAQKVAGQVIIGTTTVPVISAGDYFLP